ncbi:MAG: hypothetical protein ACOCRX_00775 [Candidatus Woesearchaeota archaeon]
MDYLKSEDTLLILGIISLVNIVGISYLLITKASIKRTVRKFKKRYKEEWENKEKSIRKEQEMIIKELDSYKRFPIYLNNCSIQYVYNHITVWCLFVKDNAKHKIIRIKVKRKPNETMLEFINWINKNCNRVQHLKKRSN